MYVSHDDDGCSTKAKPSEVDKAVLSLKTQRRKLAVYQKQVTSKIAEALEQAQVHVRQGNKQRATLALKQKRILQTRLGEIDGYLVNVEETVGFLNDLNFIENHPTHILSPR